MPRLQRAHTQTALGSTSPVDRARGRNVQRLQRASYHGGYGSPSPQPQPNRSTTPTFVDERDDLRSRFSTAPQHPQEYTPQHPQEYPGGARRPGARSDPWSGSRTARGARDMRHGRTYMVASRGTGEYVLRKNSTGTLVSVRAKPSDPKPKPKVGGHYEYICGDLLENESDEERDEHDRMLADTLHRRGPSDVPHPWLSRPRNPMNSAFTDRAVRLRDGRSTKLLTTDPAHGTEWALDGVCHTSASGPSRARAAGAASHEICSKKYPHCAQNSRPAIRDFWGIETNKSAGVGDTLASRAPTKEHEEAFRKSMNGKIKAIGGSPRSTLEPSRETGMLPHRPAMPGSPAAAGIYNERGAEDSFRARSAVQGSRSCSPLRSGVALVLSPRPGDPPPPTKISLNQKGNARGKQVFSSEAEAHAKHFNQEVFRYSDPKSPRGRYSPTPDYEGLAGVPTSARDAKADRMFTSPSRLATLNSSLAMSYSLDRDLQTEVKAQERQYRLKHEKAFSDLCTTASEHALTQRTLMSTVKSLVGHNTSSIDFTWVGAEE